MTRQLFLMGVMISLVACKPQENAGTKSLDNLTAGKVAKVNSCSGRFSADTLHPAAREKMGESVAAGSPIATALTAVPTVLQELYFSAGHKVCATSLAVCAKHRPGFDVSSCAVALGREAASKTCSELASDVLSMEQLPAVGAEVVIVSFVDEKLSAHGTVRAIAQALVKYLGSLDVVAGDQGEAVEYGADDPGLAAVKKAVLSAYVADLRQKGRTTAVAEVADILAGKRPEGAATAETLDSVFAEAMDQFYCDGDFDSETAKMRGEFAAVHSVLLHDFHQALGAGDSEQAAFGLWRFPLIRGAFRARSNLVGRVGSFPRLRTGRVFPRAWGY